MSNIFAIMLTVFVIGITIASVIIKVIVKVMSGVREVKKMTGSSSKKVDTSIYDYKIEVKCEYCGTINDEKSGKCTACGAPLKHD